MILSVNVASLTKVNPILNGNLEFQSVWVSFTRTWLVGQCTSSYRVLSSFNAHQRDDAKWLNTADGQPRFTPCCRASFQVVAPKNRKKRRHSRTHRPTSQSIFKQRAANSKAVFWLAGRFLYLMFRDTHSSSRFLDVILWVMPCRLPSLYWVLSSWTDFYSAWRRFRRKRQSHRSDGQFS